MNLKDYDDADLYDESIDYQEYEEDSYVERSSGKKSRRNRKKKKGSGMTAMIFVVVLLSISVIAAVIAAVYLLFFTKFDQNASNADKPIYTQAQFDQELQAVRLAADQRVNEAFDSGVEEGKRTTLTTLSESLIATGSSITSLRPFYPDKVIVVSQGTFHFVDINRDLKLTDISAEGLRTDDDGILTYVSDGEVLSHKGIDVSSFQGDIDWELVKADGVEFAIMRAAYRGYGTGKLVDDDKFEDNISGALEQGINVGAYVFSQAITEEEVIEEAETTIEKLSPYVQGCPVIIDVEFTGDGGRMDKLTASERTELILKFCEVVKNAGYKPYVYYNTEMSILYVDLPRLEDIPKWYASYSSDFFYPYDIDILQYSASGRVAGVKGDVDLDICFKPFW